MRVLLVNPWIYDFKCYDFWIKPLGLLKLSSLFKKAGHEVRLVDCMDRHDPGMPENNKKGEADGRGAFYCEAAQKPVVYENVPRKYKQYGLPRNVFEEKINNMPAPDIILITSNMTYTYEGALAAYNILRHTFPGAKIIIGGIYATLCPAHAKKNAPTAMVWRGNISPAFLKQLNRMSGAGLDIVDEKEFGEIIPDYSFYPKTPYAAVRLTSGCPFNCTYCAIKQFCEGYRQRDKTGVLKEFENYSRAGIKNIAFYDDALLYKNYFIKSVLKSVIKKGFDFNYFTPNGLHASYIDKETAGLMKKAGFRDLRISLESSDFNTQKKTGGKIYNDKFEEAVKNLKNAGFSGADLGVYILAGLPGQDFDSVKKDADYVKKLGLKIKIANYSPIPGTMDFNRLKPEIRAALENEPLKQNEFYFLCINNLYGWKENEKLKAGINEYNSGLKN